MSSFFDFKLIMNKQKDKINRWLGIKVNIWIEFRALKYKIMLKENFSPKFPIKENIKKKE